MTDLERPVHRGRSVVRLGDPRGPRGWAACWTCWYATVMGSFVGLLAVGLAVLLVNLVPWPNPALHVAASAAAALLGALLAVATARSQCRARRRSLQLVGRVSVAEIAGDRVRRRQWSDAVGVLSLREGGETASGSCIVLFPDGGNVTLRTRELGFARVREIVGDAIIESRAEAIVARVETDEMVALGEGGESVVGVLAVAGLGAGFGLFAPSWIATAVSAIGAALRLRSGLAGETPVACERFELRREGVVLVFSEHEEAISWSRIAAIGPGPELWTDLPEDWDEPGGGAVVLRLDTGEQETLPAGVGRSAILRRVLRRLRRDATAAGSPSDP